MNEINFPDTCLFLSWLEGLSMGDSSFQVSFDHFFHGNSISLILKPFPLLHVQEHLCMNSFSQLFVFGLCGYSETPAI